MNRMESTAQFAHTIDCFADKKVLVIGDAILDVYHKGTSTRLTPEAPVPVVDIAESKVQLGGAANTACNLAALGAQVTFCTVTGRDHLSEEAFSLMKNMNIRTEAVFTHPSRQTIVKTRVISGTQLLIRFDSGTETAIDSVTEEKLIEFLENTYPHYDAVVISDYDKGIISNRVVEAIARLQSLYSPFLAIDSKRLLFFSKLRATLVKPNYEEAVKLLQTVPQATGRIDQISAAGKILFAKTNAMLIAATLDEDGSLIIEKGKVLLHTPAPRIPSPYVAGAGDTFLSAFVLCYISCGNVHKSAKIATAAATIAISKDATSSCSAGELKCYFNLHSKYTDSIKDLTQVCETYRTQGKRIVFTNGCFDILHSGHVTYLHCARELGDVLIVGVNNDDSIRRLKGESRPINPLRDRAQVLSGLTAVDHIIPFGDIGDDTPVKLIHVIRPDVFVKGGDYTKDKLPEAKTVEDAGGQIVFIPFIPHHSTTSIIKRISSQVPLQAIQSVLDHE